MSAFDYLSIPQPEPFADLLSLKGRVAIVTGGTRGIGAAIVLRLTQAGATVVVTGRTEKTLRAIEEKVAVQGGRAVGMAADAASLSDGEAVVSTTIEQFGRIDILVNNAAIFPGALTIETSEALWDATVDADLKGAFFISKQVAQAMIEGGRGGRIVNILSTEMMRPTGILAAYGAAKAGLLAVTQSMAKELGQYGIQVNAVMPGSTLTAEKVAALKAGHMDGPFVEVGSDVPKTAEIVKAMLDSGSFEQAHNHMPLRRHGYPDDLAKAVLFMASDMASYVTGTSLIVEGGQTTA